MRNLIRRVYRFLYPRMYSRHDLKLLLGASLEEMSERTRLLTAATDYFQGGLRPVPVRAPFGESVLVIAPHQDDEAIGCGGALAAQVASGKAALVLLLEDGGYGHDDFGLTRGELNARRNAESVAAARIAGLAEPPVFLNHPNIARAGDEIVKRLVEILRSRKVDAVFSPYPLDGHVDHRVTASLLARALEQIEWPVRVLTYEVWGFCLANVVFPIDEYVEQKRKMIDAFAWANQALDYTNSTLGLNQLRSRQLPAGACRYAECFFELPKAEYVEFVRMIEGKARG